MTSLATALNSTASFEVAALFVTWVAIVLVGLVAGNVHQRLQRLERSQLGASGATPYSHLLGKSVRDLVTTQPLTFEPRVLVFLSSTCSACRRVLNELSSSSWTTPSAIVWTDRSPSPAPLLSSQTLVLDEGPKISAALGVHVTPFAVITNAEGKTVKALPINTLQALSEWLDNASLAPSVN